MEKPPAPGDVRIAYVDLSGNHLLFICPDCGNYCDVIADTSGPEFHLELICRVGCDKRLCSDEVYGWTPGSRKNSPHN